MCAVPGRARESRARAYLETDLMYTARCTDASTFPPERPFFRRQTEKVTI